MSIETKFPVTLAERLELGADITRFPATWQEYLDLLEVCNFQIEYDNEEIILMSIASDPHEVITPNIITCLNVTTYHPSPKPLCHGRRPPLYHAGGLAL